MIYLKIYLHILLFSIFQIAASAQIGNPAPDFTATDTHGETHTLYDYLEEGKVVVLDFFYTTCGPCQFYSPQVNLAYEKYGCNTADVIFMSIDWGDTDAEVLAYDEEYQIEYPSISGIDGGGNTIVNLYDVSGFPTFYVIDSSKTIIDQIDPPTLQVFDFRFEQHGIFPTACNTSSVSESVLNKQLQLFPNPISFGDLIVEFSEKLSGKANIEIFDLFGKMVKKATVDLDGITHLISVDQLSSGTYLIKMESIINGESYTGLFIKI